MIEGGTGTQRVFRLPAVVWSLIALMVAVELVLTGADLHLWGQPWWRPLTYQYAGFWPGLLGSWQPNYALQPAAMFATYGFLHAGLWHLGVNVLTLALLAPPLVARLGRRPFYLLYALSLVGGAIGYAVMTASAQPMVGCSGALFGLAGAYLALDFLRRYDLHLTLLPVLAAIAALALGNALTFWLEGGQLAWQAHLGGFVTGWIFGVLPHRGPGAD